MNTYKQDLTIPIYIFLQYEHYVLKFPINPESIKKEIPSPSTTTAVEGLGEVSQPQTPGLARITIESFFWQSVNLVPSSFYILWLEKWQKSKKPANLIVTRLNYCMQVSCERFDHWINGGEEEDIYFTLELKEYRPHGAKRLKKTTNKSVLQSLQALKDLAVLPVLLDIPRPSRNSSTKMSFVNPYETKEGETISSITKKITGKTDDWKSLYDENRGILGDIFSEGREIDAGTKLTLPQSWVQNKAYRIKTAGIL